MSETLRESTWRERQAAKMAAADALHDLVVAQDAEREAKHRYWDALDAEKAAVQANIEAWQDDPT